MKTYEFTKYTLKTGRWTLNEYFLEEFPDNWLCDIDHYDDWDAWHGELNRMYEEILERASEVGCIGIWLPGSAFWYYVHVSPEYGGMRVTCWDDLGPISHEDLASGKELAREIKWNSVTVYEEAA